MRFILSEHITKADLGEALAGTRDRVSERPTYKIRLGLEDLLPLVMLVLLLAGYLLKELTFKELLAYLGVSTGGGLWGLISGKVQTS